MKKGVFGVLFKLFRNFETNFEINCSKMEKKMENAIPFFPN